MLFTQSKSIKTASVLAALLLVTACSKKPAAEAPAEEKPVAEASATTTEAPADTATATASETTAPTADDIAANPEVEGMELTE